MNTHELMMPMPETELNNIDGRVKLALTISGLITAVAAKTWELPLFFGVVSLFFLVLAGMPVNLVLKRLRPVLYVATLIGLTQIFFYGHTLWFQWNIGIVRLSGYYEGLGQGILLASRVFGGMSVMLLLTMSTSVQEWVSALAWFKIPLTVIEVMTLAYSSLFVLLEELDRLQKAQRMRLGYGSWWQIVRATGTVGGILFMRVFDKSYRLWQAMLCRGYNGKIQVCYERKLTRKDIVVAVGGLVLITGSWTLILS
ncbi:MAG: cobalt ECF transporter T component CbiQ [Desulfitobacteriaceae bacterium]